MIKRIFSLFTIVAVMICLLVISRPPVQAQTGGGFDLTWNTFDGGGVIGSSGGNFSLSGTIGQHDASAALLSFGGAYSLVGGFWPGIPPYRIFVPVSYR